MHNDKEECKIDSEVNQKKIVFQLFETQRIKVLLRKFKTRYIGFTIEL